MTVCDDRRRDPLRARAIEATVRGVVQGVGFRWFVAREAGSLGLTGWVANQSDGSVVLLAEGDSASIDALVGVLREGPPGASVSSVSFHDVVPTGAHYRFEIRSGAHRGD